MTNYEANNSSSASTSLPGGFTWAWLSERLPSERLEQLTDWLSADLSELENSMAHMVTERSLKRDLRHEFASSKRGA